MGKLRGTGVVLVWVDIDPARQAEVDRWYEQEHLPERITESGYLRARRFSAVSGTPAYMGMLEAETPEALAGEGYRRVTATIDDKSRSMRNSFGRVIRSTHSVLKSIGTIDGAVTLCARLIFSNQTQRAAYAQWGRSNFEKWVRLHPQILGGHALAGAPEIRRYMDSYRASGQEDESADGVILLEFGRPSDAHEKVASCLSVEGLAAQGVLVKESALSIYQLMIDMGPHHFKSEPKTAM